MSKPVAVPLIALACALGPLAAVASAAPRDRDRDHLPDRWEHRHHLSTHKRNGHGDPDHDGLTNRREYKLRTNPRRKDTDHDGLRDKAEIRRYKTNPRRKDTDHDGLRDKAEIRRYKTNPRRKDTDHDGYGDGVEVRRGTNPRDPRSHPRSGSSSPQPPSSPAPPSATRFPSPSNTGVPARWTPATTVTHDLNIDKAGTVVQDVRLVNASIYVHAPNVTIRRVDVQGGWIDNDQGPTCGNGLLIEDTTLEPPPGSQYSVDTEGVISYGGYTARRVKIWRRSEGFRVGASPECGAVRIEDSFVKVVIPPGHDELHTDGIQGYGGGPASLSNVTIDSREAMQGTAPFFFPRDQGNTSVDVNRLLVMGSGFPFRLGVPGRVTGLKIVNRSWDYGPIDVRCSDVSPWDADIVTITPDYQIASTVRRQPCNTEGGG